MPFSSLVNGPSEGNEGTYVLALPPNHASFRTHYPSIHLRPSHLRSYPGRQVNRQPGCPLGSRHWNEVKELMVSAKQLGRWRPACRQQIRWNRGVFSLQMSENLLNNHGIFDAGDDFHRAAHDTAAVPGRVAWIEQWSTRTNDLALVLE